MKASHFTPTLDQRHDGFLRRRIFIGPVFGLASDVGFVGLNEFAAAAHVIRQLAFTHRFAQPMAHEPSRFQADTKRPMKLMAADPFLAAAHQECALEPDMQSNMALFKNRPDLDRKLLTAIVALPQPYAGGFASKAAAVIDPAAMRADRTLRPQDAL